MPLLALRDEYVKELTETFHQLTKALHTSAVSKVQFNLVCGQLDKGCMWTHAMPQEKVYDQPLHDNCILNTFGLELILHNAADALSHPVVLAIITSVVSVMQGHDNLRMYLSFATLAPKCTKPSVKAAVAFQQGTWQRPPEWKYCSYDDAFVDYALQQQNEDCACDEAALAQCLTRCCPATCWKPSIETGIGHCLQKQLMNA